MINSELQNKLRQQFNPDGSEIRRYQLRILDILKYIDRICRENNIRYWASSGTCLGAIRHAGFIPWDDDADIEMTYDDFKRFKKAVKKDSDPNFVFYDHEIDNEYVTQFPKITDLRPFDFTNKHYDIITMYHKYQGPFVDIFPIMPSNSHKLNFISGKIQGLFLFRLNHISNKRLRIALKRIIYFVLHNIAFPLLRRLENLFVKNKFRHISGVGFTIPRNKKDIDSTIYVKFEDTTIPVPVNYDSYLKLLFGDYNNLPDPSIIEMHAIDFTPDQTHKE